MPTIPEAIGRRDLEAALTGLGIDFTELRRVVCDPHTVELTYRELNAYGKPYMVDGTIAENTYSVPMVADTADSA